VPRRLLASFVALAIGMAVVAVAALHAAAVDDNSGPAPIAWKACGGGFQCGTLSVPVDYTQPGGAQLRLALTRERATDTRHRLGSLVINFGGPGDPGSMTLREFVGEVPAEVRTHYDLVSFDPRGIGNSKPIECVDNKTVEALVNEDPTPNGAVDLRAFYDGTHDRVDLTQACITRSGAWLSHVGSRDVARDLDRLRIALGDQRLHYLGFSYGTVIGSVYAQMFPATVGHLVLDGPVDLSWSAQEELAANGASFEHALDAFLTDCAKRSRCPFHSGGEARPAFIELQRRFEAGLTLATTNASGRRSSRRAGVAAFYVGVLSALYDKQFGWPTLAQGLQEATKGDGTLLLLLADSYNGRRADGSYDNSNEAIGIILCDDRFDAMPTFDQFVAQYNQMVATYPLLGAFVGSTRLGCDPRLPRPTEADQLGDVRVTGIRPVLIIGTTQDPATPYEGARDLARRIGGSRVITFESTEHTAYTKSRCIDRAVDAYLLHDDVPSRSLRCR
jgi:pimeloyl-ACP methyl ester carboxylesterase